MSIFGGKKSVKKSTKKSRKQRYKTFLQVSGTEDGAEYGDSGGYESGRGVRTPGEVKVRRGMRI